MKNKTPDENEDENLAKKNLGNLSIKSFENEQQQTIDSPQTPAIKKPKRISKFYRHPKIAFAAAILVIGLTAFVATVHFTKTNLMKLSIAGVPISKNINDQTAAKKLLNASDGYRLIFKYQESEPKTFNIKDTGITVDIPATIAEAKKARKNTPLASRLAFWQTQQLKLDLKVDETALSAFVDNQINQVKTPAKNAGLAIENGEVKLLPSSSGEGIILADGKNTIKNGVSSLKSAPYNVKLSKIEPSIIEHDLAKSNEKAENVLSQNVEITIDTKVIKAKPADIGNWIELTPVESDKTIDVTVNSGKVLEYLNKISKSHINPAKAQIVSTQEDGSVVVLARGQNGADINKKEAVAAEITSKISDGKDIKVTVPVVYTPFKTVTAQSYDKWLAVDTTAKRMYAYEKTNLVRTFLISAGAPNTPTVLGQYSIKTKVAKQDMRGRNTDGSRYFQADVRWVNYFYEDYAIHGNHWRPLSYFGNINSSHGCVGIVNSDAEWVYNWAPVGTPVIVFE